VKRKCPECGELRLKRLIGAGAAVMFKGSGFYQTDYRSESYKKRAAEETSTPSETKTDKAADSPSKPKKKSADTREAKK
jgi:predicted nucleic acid-binding Zn ribbon protein